MGILGDRFPGVPDDSDVSSSVGHNHRPTQREEGDSINRGDDDGVKLLVVDDSDSLDVGGGVLEEEVEVVGFPPHVEGGNILQPILPIHCYPPVLILFD